MISNSELKRTLSNHIEFDSKQKNTYINLKHDFEKNTIEIDIRQKKEHLEKDIFFTTIIYNFEILAEMFTKRQKNYFFDIKQISDHYHYTALESYFDKKLALIVAQQKKNEEQQKEINKKNVKNDENIKNKEIDNIKENNINNNKEININKEINNKEINNNNNNKEINKNNDNNNKKKEDDLCLNAGNISGDSEICCICQCEFFDDLANFTIEKLIENLKLQNDEVPIGLMRCDGHYFHKSCLTAYIAKKNYIKCPVCSIIYGEMIGSNNILRFILGDQPDGKMHVNILKGTHCAGYNNCDTIEITYSMKGGKRGNISFGGTSRNGYLPNNEEGRKTLKLLQKAFDRKLIFTVGKKKSLLFRDFGNHWKE